MIDRRCECRVEREVYCLGYEHRVAEPVASRCRYCLARMLPAEYMSRGMVLVPRMLAEAAEKACPNWIRACPFFERDDRYEISGTDYYAEPWIVSVLALGVDERIASVAFRRAARSGEWQAALQTVLSFATGRAEVEMFIEQSGGHVCELASG